MGFFDIFTGGLGGGGGGSSSGGLVGGVDTSSKATTQNVDERATASEGSLSVGSGRFVEGPDFSGASNVTITATPDAAANQTISDLATGLTAFLRDQNEAAITTQKSNDELLRDVLTKLTEQSTAKETGFQSLLISPLFWLGMAGLGVLGIFLWRKAR